MGSTSQIGRRVSRATLGRVKKEWDARQSPSPVAEDAASEAPTQTVLDPPCVAETEPVDVAVDVPVVEPSTNDAPTEKQGVSSTLRAQPVRSAQWVQQVGTWLLLAMLHRVGLYDAAGECCADAKMRGPLRIALDAFACALALGEGCVEGVRRLMTASGRALVRANRAPSATWVRRVLGAFARDQRAARLHLAMARRYVHQAHVETERDVVVFYIDNHLRPYTGKETIRKGWRMQDKRVRPARHRCLRARRGRQSRAARVGRRQRLAHDMAVVGGQALARHVGPRAAHRAGLRPWRSVSRPACGSARRRLRAGDLRAQTVPTAGPHGFRHCLHP